MGSDGEAIGIGLMGLGGVGSGVAKILQEKAEVYARQIGRRLEIRRVLVRDPSKPRDCAIDPALLTTKAGDLLGDPRIQLVIEVMGAEEPSYAYLRDALTAGKFVVTANKEVMAKHGADLLALAREHTVDLLYEASVGGGIPIIAPLKRDLLANDIMSVRAIINGTTNYILTSMAKGGGGFAEALAGAQRLRYAEPDPTDDVEAIDAAYKLSILATLAFHVDVHPEDVYREGITKLSERDFRFADELGYAIKLLAIGRRQGDGLELLAIGRRQGDGLELRVHPALIGDGELLARVDGVLNAVEIEGDLMGRVLFEGPGAGSLPTTSAVVADALDAAVSIKSHVYWPYSSRREEGLRVMPMEDLRTRYYLRIAVADQPGVLARIATALSEGAISIASVIQKEVDGEGTAEIVIMTHEAREDDMRRALARIGALEGVASVRQLLRVAS